ncbi:amidohydrolase [Pseudomonas silesiensis]|uniref:N-acyl-L-amino acid amidohydrolase n=1 Tax=Pseudomonas silesiensis TaxID=1853130 RepID=A0A191YT87_9PSED|nr:amidohydrolase [Pseudomonas silesiensis]ANJ55946.1 N-acyl-L-amino acid amidohydrolase [Pseudomonas silesiensis]VVO75308.1 Hippurate hydrolase [Pseudomonas fluorescens]
MRISSLPLGIALLSTFSTAFCQASDFSWVDPAVASVSQDVIELRHTIHQNPELGNMEVKTSELVAQQLKALGMEVRTHIGKTGVVGVLKGGKPGPVVALRADMDALPVKEMTGLPFASTATGVRRGKTVPVMHACGHDTHTAMLLGAAKVLAEHRNEVAGTVVFLFQPAEEGAADVDEFEADAVIGARAMIRDGALDSPKVEAIFGVHVMAGYPTGHLYYKSGTVLNSNDAFRITVKGQQTHGSAPWSGVDPIIASENIVGGLQTLVSRRIDMTKGMGVISVGTMNAGAASNIIPETAELTGTIRTNNASIRDTILQKMPPLVNGIASAYETKANLLLVNIAPVTINNPALTEAMVPALELAAPGKVERLESSLSPSEDFSFYAEKVPGLFVFLGATPADQDMQKVPNNHSPYFTADDATLATGVKAHVQFVLNYPGRVAEKP